MNSLPSHVRIVEVGPRDGLQNEKETISTSDKLAFIRRLVEAGLHEIEVTSFVHPKAVPQLADASEIIAGLPAAEGVTFSALVPNLKGLQRALDTGVRRVAVFTAASERFTQENIRMSIEESISVFDEVSNLAQKNGASVRGYLSTCFVCPFQGEVEKTIVRDLTSRLLDLGVDEVSISDTIGAAVPNDVFETVGHILKTIPKDKLALHFHDTYGTALSNVLAGLQLGITTFDASAGGLGGCPFAPGAAGNLATEDIVYFLDRSGINTGVDLDKLAEASSGISRVLARQLPSRVLQHKSTH